MSPISRLDVEMRAYIIVGLYALFGNGGEFFLKPFNGGAAQPVFVYSFYEYSTRCNLRINGGGNPNRLSHIITWEGDWQIGRLFVVILSNP